MQKWCPEPLEIEANAGTFQPLAMAPGAAPQHPGFRPEAGFADPRGLMRQLSRDERTLIMELLEQDLRREYEERFQTESEERRREEEERVRLEAEARRRWQEELSAGLRREVEEALGGLARHTVEMALLMAAKVVRREVATDPEVLVRTLETVLYKVEAGGTLSVTVQPDDAAWLKESPELCARLRIAEIKEDRRLDRGGCLVKADDLEWDATVERQLAVLGEAMTEALAIPVQADDSGPEEPRA